MKHYHAVRCVNLFCGFTYKKLDVLTSDDKQLTLDDVIQFSSIMPDREFGQSFYIGYGDESILDKYRGLGLI